MRHRACLALALELALSSACASDQAHAGDSPFEVAVRCHRNPGCVVSGKRLPLRIAITNRSGRDAYLTVDYMRETGPYTTITDTGSGTSRYGHTALASDALLSRYQHLAPGASAIVPYILYESEIGSSPGQPQCAALRVDFDFHARWGWEHERGYSFEDKAVLIIPGNGRPGCGNKAEH